MKAATQRLSGRKRKNLELVQALIAAGANIEAQDLDQGTALHHADYLGHSEILDVLLQAGANVNARDHRQQTPLHKAVLSLQHTLYQEEIFGGTNLRAYKERKEIIEALVNNNAHINAIDQFCHTPLCLMGTTLLYCQLPAAIETPVVITQYLLQKGANIKLLKSDIDTIVNSQRLLEWAFEKKEKSLIIALLIAGINTRTADGHDLLESNSYDSTLTAEIKAIRAAIENDIAQYLNPVIEFIVPKDRKHGYKTTPQLLRAAPKITSVMTQAIEIQSYFSKQEFEFAKKLPQELLKIIRNKLLELLLKDFDNLLTKLTLPYQLESVLSNHLCLQYKNAPDQWLKFYQKLSQVYLAKGDTTSNPSIYTCSFR